MDKVGTLQSQSEESTNLDSLALPNKLNSTLQASEQMSPNTAATSTQPVSTNFDSANLYIGSKSSANHNAVNTTFQSHILSTQTNAVNNLLQPDKQSEYKSESIQDTELSFANQYFYDLPHFESKIQTEKPACGQIGYSGAMT